MIFITVGTQLPFDRLIKALDQFYADKKVEVFAQIGPSEYVPSHFPYVDFISPLKADEMFKKASLIIAHAGMGSILTALKYQVPILVVPRKATLNEHRNNHQVATANWVKTLSGVLVAQDEYEALSMLQKMSTLTSGEKISPYAEDRLLEYLSEIIKK